MSEPKGKRNIQLNFLVSSHKLDYVVKLDLPEIKELLSLMRRSSNNLNQLTKRVHETGRIYDADMEYIVQKQNDIWDGLNKVLPGRIKFLASCNESSSIILLVLYRY